MIVLSNLPLEKQQEILLEAILDRQIRINNTQIELKEIQRAERDVDWIIRKRKCLEYIRDFIFKHGNILGCDLHEELRKGLLGIMYDEKRYIISYDLTLTKVLSRLFCSVKYEYLNESKNKKDIKFKIELREE